MPYCCFSSSSVRCFVDVCGVTGRHVSLKTCILATWKRLPLFLFQTCIGSGIAPFLALALEFLAEFPSPLVDLATRRGRDPCVSETVDELDEGMLASHVSWMFAGLCVFINHLSFQQPLHRLQIQSLWTLGTVSASQR